MSFDDFCDWLDNALTVEDLEEAKEMVKESGAPKDYLKIIDKYIKDKSDEEKNSDEEDTTEEVG
jgi:hypothetical protein